MFADPEREKMKLLPIGSVMKSLENRVALVTGSSSGIGQAIAEKLAQVGANIVINYAGHREGAEETLKTG